MEDDILLQILKEDPDIKDADERYRQFIADDELREQYQDRIKEERDRRSQIIFARNEGRVEERLTHARRMKAHGDSLEYIAEVTGLSVDEVNGID